MLLAPKQEDVWGSGRPVQDDGEVAPWQRKVQGVATGLRSQPSRRILLLTAVSGPQGRPVFGLGDHHPIHREPKLLLPPHAPHVGEPGELHGPHHSLLHKPDHARGHQQGDSAPDCQQQDRNPRPPDAPLQDPRGPKFRTGDPKRLPGVNL